MPSSTRRSYEVSIEDTSRILVVLSSNGVVKEHSKSGVADRPLRKVDSSKEELIMDKENDALTHSPSDETGRTMTRHDQAVANLEQIGVALSLLSLKSSSDMQTKAPKTVRFRENVQVREYMRCCGDAPAAAKDPLGPTLKYALGLTWIISSESTTFLTDKLPDAPKPSPLSEDARCRVLVETIGADNLVQELALQQMLRTNSRAIKSIEKEMASFLNNSTPSAP